MMKSLDEHKKFVHISQEELSHSRQPYYRHRTTPQSEEIEEQIVAE